MRIDSGNLFRGSLLSALLLWAPALAASAGEIEIVPRSFGEQYHREIIALLAMLLLLLFIIIAFYEHLRRLAVRRQALYHAIPARIAVVNAKGKFCFSHLNDGTDEAQHLAGLRRLVDLPGDMRTSFTNVVRETMRSGDPQTLEYQQGGRHRRADFLKLPVSVFGEQAVMWISVDTEELHCARSGIRALSDRFELTLDAIGEGVIATDRAGVITLVNPAAAREMSCAPEQLIGKNLADAMRLVDPDTGRLLNHPVEPDTHALLPSASGEPRHLLCNSTPIRTPDGTSVGGVLVFRNITASKLNERKRNDLAILLQAVLDNLPAVITAKDIHNDFRYVLWNKTTEKLTGIAADDAIGKTDAELFCYAPMAAELQRHAEIASRNGQLKYTSTLAIPGQPSYTFINNLTKVEYDRKHAMLLVLGLDITEEKRLEAERQQLLENLRQHIELERTINLNLESLLCSDDDSQTMHNILAVTSEYLKADNAYIIQNNYRQKKLQTIAVWQRPRSNSNIVTPEDLLLDESQPWFIRFQDRKALLLSNLTAPEQAEQAGNWLAYYRRNHLNATLALGLRKNERLWGHIEFAFETPHDFTAHDTHLLRSVAHLVELILDRKCRREMLARSESEKQLIMDSIKIPIMLHDTNLNMVFCNNAARTVTGLSEAELFNRSCFEIFCGKLDWPEECAIARTLQDGGEHSHKLHWQGRDYQVNAYPILINGKLTNILKILLDVTEFNEVQQQLSHALDEAQQANKAKSFFLASMSHELRTPLNAVIGFSELLMDNNTPQADQAESVRAINVAGKTLLSLINNVLDLSRLEAEQTVLDPQPTNLVTLLREIHTILRPRAEAKQLVFKFRAPEKLPILRLDGRRVRQILLNLIGNALKFTEHGFVTTNVHLRDSGELTIEVADSGSGIAPEYQDKIFLPFIQQDAIRDTHMHNGTGLGLTISRQLATRMGGEITLHSEVGKGSVFTLRLQVEIPQPGETPLARKSATQTLMPQAENMQVLVVDDVPMNLKVLEAMLKRFHFKNVSIAESAAQALQLFRENPPHLVLTDIWMPDMNGSELAAAIRRLPGGEQIKIIAVTADSEVAQNFEVGNFDAMLQKPVTLQKLAAIFAREYSQKITL